MRIRLTALCGIGAVLAMAPGARADETLRYTYVANSFGYYTSLDEGQPSGFALAGQIRFRPRHSTVTIRIDDRTIPNGQTVAVWVYGAREGGFARCLEVRKAVKIRGFEPGKETIVTVLADGAWLPDPGPGCTGHASGGTADVTL
ncbi:MAG TPA: hypothetical protein VNA12_10725 [Mycobacteriales bacterium]|nr:hypothetical protein [Mycobacteriales bacterium]